MFPGFLTMILIYKVFSDLGLTMQMAPIGLVIVYCASSGMGYYVSKGFFDTIPTTLDEAARVDGATRFQVFYKVILPLSKPIIIYTILMGFMAPWGDFMLASYIIHENSAGMSVAVGMYEWLSKTMVNSNYTMFCAAGVVVAIPVTAVFLALQKYYVDDGKIYFNADSDAIITKGIISLLIGIYSGRTPQEIMSSDFSVVEKIGLKENLSPTRANGLVSMIEKIRETAARNA